MRPLIRVRHKTRKRYANSANRQSRGCGAKGRKRQEPTMAKDPAAADSNRPCAGPVPGLAEKSGQDKGEVG
jgi:hypothetical protein